MPSRTHSAGCSTEIRGSGPASTFAGVVLAHVAPEAATRDDDAFYAAVGPDAGVAVDLEAGTVRIDGRAFGVDAATPHERAVRQAGGIVGHLRAKWNADPEPVA